MSKDEAAIENEIQSKGLNAPRLNPRHIDDRIACEYYFRASDAIGADVPLVESLSCLTFCVLVLGNGFTVTGESACASPANYDRQIGEKIAYENARAKIWPLEGYLLRERLSA